MVSAASGGAPMERWSPPVELSRLEQALMKRLTRVAF
jgi:hypothetical protein